MFTIEARAELRSDLLDRAARDPRITGGAITGSAALDREDRWSDIDLAFGVEDPAKLAEVLSEWTTYMYDEHRAVHHVDTKFGRWIYRTFLLSSTLQVDLAFTPATEFRALTPKFRIVFGEANDAAHWQPPQPTEMVRLSWPYAIEARHCIQAGRLWQAEYAISALRDDALALACIRYHLPAQHGRGFDALPGEITAALGGALVLRIEPAEVNRAMEAAVNAYLDETRRTDEALASRLRETLKETNSEHPEPAPGQQRPHPGDVAGLGWLYALHVRSSLARRKFWQAEYMVSGVRDHAFALACLRNGLPVHHACAAGVLAPEIRAKFETSLVRQINHAELLRAFAAVMDVFTAEIRSSPEGFTSELQETCARLRERGSSEDVLQTSEAPGNCEGSDKDLQNTGMAARW